MTASAITPTVPSSPRTAASGRARAETGDDAASPFASLLGGAAPSARPARSEEPAAGEDAASDTDADLSATATTTELPAWLLALRAAPATTANPPAPAAGFADDGATGTDKLPAGIIPLPQSADRLLRSRDVDPAPPLPAPVPRTPAAFAATAEPLAVDPAALTVLPADPELALDGAQVSALDAALGKLAAATDSPVNAMSASVPVTRPASAEPPAVVAPPPPDLGTLTDAFGEPLALDSHDAALRMGERLRWLSESGVQEARMQLHPRELGSVDVRIRIEGQSASVWFGAEHPAARAALEATLPQLRQQLAGEGFSLADAQVGGHGAGANGGEPRRDAPQSAADSRLVPAPAAADALPARAPSASARGTRGLVDRYA